MIISIMVEGSTEKIFIKGALHRFLESRLSGRMPRLDPVPHDKRIPTSDKLRKEVILLLGGKNPADAVIALTDVYTGTAPPEFKNAEDAKRKMRKWVGDEARFHPHAAQYEFEAWLLPYWDHLQRLAGHNAASPGADPEKVNHQNPPSKRIEYLFRRGSRRKYGKIRDASHILRDVDLLIAVGKCKELKALVNTILTLCGGEIIL
jgi:hypothetical protein